jgi:hypothetical protein
VPLQSGHPKKQLQLPSKAALFVEKISRLPIFPTGNVTTGLLYRIGLLAVGMSSAEEPFLKNDK